MNLEDLLRTRRVGPRDTSPRAIMTNDARIPAVVLTRLIVWLVGRRRVETDVIAMLRWILVLLNMWPESRLVEKNDF
jgi:hypothetical protein